ncbi:hypothetical protein [Massilia sp. AB1]|uniref:hypothetical protein n=1 Tax=Massilia sp. AB1 TaxID=2823371 RepID=UPI001B817183|nr:hypothetical protein [Massilia sp. AB1]MBQ5941069.1 hypothetical protein [Massilia sp. AB1]
MQHTLVAVFDNRTDAQNAMNELLSSGFSKGEVRLSNADPTGQTDSATGESDIAGDRDLAHDRAGDSSSLGIAASIKHFFSDLFGSDNPDHVSRYEGAVTRGHHVLTVTASSLPEVERAADIVERYGPTDIDEQASGFGEVPSGAGAMRMGTSSGMQAAPMSQQSASSQSAAAPVQSQQRVQDQALDNPGDRKLFQQQSLNQAEPMGTTYQEPMGKSGLSATGGTSLHGSTLQENPVQGSSLEGTPQGLGTGGSIQGSSTGNPVRSDSQQYAGVPASGASRLASQQRGGSRIYSRGDMGQSGYSTGADIDDDTYFREHFSSTYGADSSYDDYAPAYRYGSQMRGDSRYRSRQWDEVENDLRSDWETRNPGSTWEKMKSAVRRGWDRMTGDDDDAYYRSHYSSAYASSGKSYDEVAPAYAYGNEMARSEIYRNRPWDEAMPSLRSDWESRNGTTATGGTSATGSAWEDMKDAVRHGWNRMTGALSDDDDSYYRNHYTSTYGTSGESYDTYRPAYEYGSSMHRNPQYSNRAWDDELENELRSGWQSRYPGGPSTWDKVKEAVRHGWNRLTY